MRKLRLHVRALLPFCLLVALSDCGGRPTGFDSSPIDVSLDPEQADIQKPEVQRFDRDGYEWAITPKASYVLRGVVLHRKSYGGDWNSILAPCDVAMGWGELAKEGLWRKVKWSQSGRWYHWRYGNDFGHDSGFVERYSSNTHIIPATQNLKRAARALKPGRIAELRGFLVRVDGRKGDRPVWWESSMSRTDQGGGSCEVLYLKALRVEGKVYE